MEVSSERVFSLKFVLLCVSSFLFSASFNMLIPELPAYLSALGGAQYKGLIIGLFTLTAGIARPFSGKLTDSVGRVPVMAIGSLVCVVCGCLYPALNSVAAFLLLRLCHGFSVGFKPTATAAYVADITPESRWGEAMGIHSMSFSCGLAIGPALGSFVASHYSIDVLFYASSAIALCSVIVLLNVPETLTTQQAFRAELLRVRTNELIEARVLPAAIATFLSYIPYGLTLTLIPDWSQSLGVRNKGSFFIYLTLASLFTRFVAGKLADKRGRVWVFQVAMALLVVGMLLIAAARSPWLLMSGAVVYGLASGLASPAASAWTADLSHPQHRGRAMATMFISLELGIGLGAVVAGFIYADKLERVPWLFGAGALAGLTGLVYLLHYEKAARAAVAAPQSVS
jgi:MFS family permease